MNKLTRREFCWKKNEIWKYFSEDQRLKVTMEWEEARAEFFHPSDRSVSDSIGGLTTTSSSRRTVLESGTADSRRSRSNAPLVPITTNPFMYRVIQKAKPFYKWKCMLQNGIAFWRLCNEIWLVKLTQGGFGEQKSFSAAGSEQQHLWK